MIRMIIGIALMLAVFFDMLDVDYDRPKKPLWNLTHRYGLLLAGWLILFMAGAAAVFTAGGIPAKVIAIISALLFVFLFHIAVDPGHLVHILRGKNDKIAVRTAGNQTGPELWEKKYYLTSDVPYESKYPNSFLDIYRTEKVPSEKRPVFIYAHGGGYIFGDKSNGDPNALGIKGVIRMVCQMLDAGFTVISTEYVFAPEYRYPSPVLQIEDLLRFLKQHEEDWGLDMNRVVLGGGSAGGQLMAQTACLQTNPEYAKEMKVEPVLTNGEIKAVYHGCALLDNERFGKTNSFLTNYIFHQMGRAYFHNAPVLKGNAECIQSDVIRHVTKNYPPSYITDGNAGTFNTQAHDHGRQAD